MIIGVLALELGLIHTGLHNVNAVLCAPNIGLYSVEIVSNNTPETSLFVVELLPHVVVIQLLVKFVDSKLIPPFTSVLNKTFPVPTGSITILPFGVADTILEVTIDVAFTRPTKSCCDAL
jgi:hypothetical protein